MRISKLDLDIAVDTLNQVSKQRYHLVATYDGGIIKCQLVIGGVSITGAPKSRQAIYNIIKGIQNYSYHERQERR